MAQFEAAAVFQKRGLSDMQRSVELLARRAVALDSADAEARSCLGLALLLRGDHDGALAEHERALAISPNLASAHGERGSALVFFGATKGGARRLTRKHQA